MNNGELRAKVAFLIEEALFHEDYLLAPTRQRALRLSQFARQLVEVARVRPYLPTSPEETSFFLRLLDIGVARAIPLRDQQVSNDDITEPGPTFSISFVVPHYNDPSGLENTLKYITDFIDHNQDQIIAQVIVVDDGSKDIETIQRIIEKASRGYAARSKETQMPISLITIVKNGGPARARNVGAQHCTGEIIAFIDCGVTFASTVERLLYLVSSSIAQVAAPRIVPEGTNCTISGPLLFQEVHFPLDLGPHRGRVGEGGPHYLPSTLLVVDRATFEAHNGFDEKMRYGEDVDFVKRVARNSGRCYYDSSVIATHPPRQGLKDLSKQAFHYGSSMATLHRSTDGEIFQLSRGWINLSPISTIAASLLLQQLAMRRERSNFSDIPGQTLKATSERDSSLSSLRRTYGLAEILIKATIATIVLRSTSKSKTPRAIFFNQLKTQTECHGDLELFGTTNAKSLRGRLTGGRAAVIAFGVEAGLQIIVSVMEFKSNFEERRSEVNYGANFNQNATRKDPQIALDTTNQGCIEKWSITSAALVSIVYDISYGAGVAFGSLRERTLPISKL